MSTPSRSRSSARGDEDYFEWREAIERRQLESKRHMQTLLQETARLRKENVELRIQASSTGPPRGQRSRGQGANSRPDPESIYPETTGVILETGNVRSQERHTPMHQTPQEESSNSTRLSSKRQCDKRPQFSDAMRTRLGPQGPGKTRPPVVTTWGTHPGLLVTPMVQNVLPHPAVRQVGNLPNEPPTGSISKRLDDMLSTPFCSHIIHYDPSRGFLVPKFFHENESLREFVKRFGQTVLPVEAYSMDVVLQIFKRSICPGTPIFESLAKKPPTTMDDLFQRTSKYSLLEDDVRAATQQILVVDQTSRSGAERSVKPLDRPRPSGRRPSG
ncbi:hypothetical protein CK203_044920 [Vitis vinifera]|uniref:Retrotransposon gag domain-containing protein n=1 Tax=Vitis vinifera TaxID=29760 RepID=A0A438HFJ4_VITVI|nr:hypothetical protein CK203_044920 [Vitis vinifera]